MTMGILGDDAKTTGGPGDVKGVRCGGHVCRRSGDVEGAGRGVGRAWTTLKSGADGRKSRQRVHPERDSGSADGDAAVNVVEAITLLQCVTIF